MHRFKSAILAKLKNSKKALAKIPMNPSKAWNAKLEVASFFGV